MSERAPATGVSRPATCTCADISRNINNSQIGGRRVACESSQLSATDNGGHNAYEIECWCWAASEIDCMLSPEFTLAHARLDCSWRLSINY
jgi:hypothetical protein